MSAPHFPPAGAKTPLWDCLHGFAQKGGLRMHMPGHKGKGLSPVLWEGLAEIDYTELPPTGNLFEGDGAIRAAEDLWSAHAGMEQCLFLTGGSTEGIHAALTLTCPPGSAVLLDRGCHRAVFNAAALLDLRPVFLPRPWLEQEAVPGPISSEEVETLLASHPEIKTVCITSPNYYGVLCDIPAISSVVHRYGGKLVVDGAHGPHLFALGERGAAAADVLVLSAHKTLPALGQSALLLSNGFAHEDLRRAAALYGSSSPSYPMMASMDAARAWLEGEGGAAYRFAAEQVKRLRQKFPAVAGRPGLMLDPTRLTLMAKDGFAACRALEELGVWPEMADRGHVVCILTGMDSGEDFARLEQALAACAPHWGSRERACAVPPPPEPETVLTPRKARFSPWEKAVLEQAEGRISAEQIAPYPPGVPVIAPGERITKKALAYLRKVGYNMEQEIPVVCPAGPDRREGDL